MVAVGGSRNKKIRPIQTLYNFIYLEGLMPPQTIQDNINKIENEKHAVTINIIIFNHVTSKYFLTHKNEGNIYFMICLKV